MELNMVDQPSIEMLALSLVREYLSRKGYKVALRTFDKESNLKNESVHNRRLLAEKLKMLDLVKKNKSSETIYQSFLEMIVRNMVDQQKTSLTKKNSREAISSSMFGAESSLDGDCGFKHSTPIHSRRRSHDRKKTPLFGNDDNNNDDHQGRNLYQKSSLERQNSTDEIAGINHKLESSGSFIEELRRKKKNEQGLLKEKENEKSRTLNFPHLEQPVAGMDGLTLDDVEPVSTKDFVPSIKRNGITVASSKAGHNSAKYHGHDTNNRTTLHTLLQAFPTLDRSTKYHDSVTPITIETAVDLKTLIFGSAKLCFNAEWRRQGFYFSTHHGLEYGLVQEKGGPCGLLASVQAWVLCYLLLKSSETKPPSPNQSEQSEALAKALTHILWNSCHEAVHPASVIVALPSSASSSSPKFNATPSSAYKADALTERLDLYACSSELNLFQFMTKHLFSFQKKDGLVLFLYSVILTHGIERVRAEMDDPAGTSLIGRHGYCTQEMVNLMLTGRAASNVFDGEMDLDQTKLRGITERSAIGFLSLFEHYGSCQVGDNYKTPVHPVWVVCSESHFSVLFGLDDLTTSGEDTFDLYYFDGLGQQDEEIRLSIIPNGLKRVLNEDKDLIPPIDLCIRTKWKNASVSWNSTDPIL